MFKIIIVALLVCVAIILGVALKELFAGEHQNLSRSLILRVALSLSLLLFVIVAYLSGWVSISSYAQYL